MRRLALSVAVLMFAALWVGVPRASGATTCTGTLTGNISGPVTVPSDDTTGPEANICNIENATVSGGINVQPGGDLNVVSSTINGSVTGTNIEDMDLAGVTVTGSYSITGSANEGRGFSVCASTIQGSVSVSKIGANDFFELDGDAGENSCLGIFGGPPPLPIPEGPNTVNGSVTLSNNPGQVESAFTKIGQSLTAQGNTNPNVDEAVELENNTIANALSCSGNASVTNGGEPNQARFKTGQCVGL